MGHDITLTASDGFKLGGYRAEPQGTPKGAIVVIQEIFLTFRDIGGSGLFPQRHRLYLQFRKGRLASWKGDWGKNWMWQ